MLAERGWWVDSAQRGSAPSAPIYLQLGSVNLPLRPLQLEPGPFMLNEVQDARNAVLRPRRVLLVLLVVDDGAGLRTSVLMRYRAIFHCRRSEMASKSHDMAAIILHCAFFQTYFCRYDKINGRCTKRWPIPDCCFSLIFVLSIDITLVTLIN